MSTLDSQWTWAYPQGQFARGALAALVADSAASLRHVDYPTTASAPATHASFRIQATQPIAAILLHSHGTISGDIPLGQAKSPIECGPLTPHESIVVQLDACPPALAIPTNLLPFVQITACTPEDSEEKNADLRPGSSIPPHVAGEPITTVPLTDNGSGLFSAPAPLFGRVVIHTPEAELPWIGVGESEAEAAAPVAHREFDVSFTRESPGVWVSDQRLGMHHVMVRGGSAVHVDVRAHRRPVGQVGTFACSDDTLTTLWSTAVTTLHSCMQTLIVDGIKRDRTPWMADCASSLGTNAYSLADAQISADTIAALARPGSGHVNGIADYSLWSVIAVNLHYRYFGDREFLRQRWLDMHAMMDQFIQWTTANGLLHPQPGDHAFIAANPDGIFLDWGVHCELGRPVTALQMLWAWALKSAGEVAQVLFADSEATSPNDDYSVFIDRWQHYEKHLLNTLACKGWDPNAGAWREYVDEDSQVAPLANTLAILAGVSGSHNASSSLSSVIAATNSGTPSMRSHALRALGLLGMRAEALSLLRTWWTPMLDAGAVSFWEEFWEASNSVSLNEGGAAAAATPAALSPWEMYGRPFGKSLCHSWASGPAELLPYLTVGLRPLSPGWSTFEVSSLVDGLEWVRTSVMTPYGRISVEANGEGMTVVVPVGAHIVTPTGHHGPGRVRIPY
ncbi:MAG: alpha-L-rhamnosidase C-terminal domain-containing protein [Actinomycetaceae bacterium]|nr:alpha-L-rhamnosidase C-terminal domain-containing protein [Actinomycetaceae bacterium]